MSFVAAATKSLSVPLGSDDVKKSGSRGHLHFVASSPHPPITSSPFGSVRAATISFYPITVCEMKSYHFCPLLADPNGIARPCFVSGTSPNTRPRSARMSSQDTEFPLVASDGMVRCAQWGQPWVHDSGSEHIADPFRGGSGCEVEWI